MRNVTGFTQEHYRKLLQSTATEYPCVGFEVLDATYLPEHFAIIRHDIDMSPARSLELAQIEAELGVRATYTVLLTGEFYSPFETSTRDTLKRIVSLGHDIGLHFDAAWHNIDSEEELENAISWETQTLNRLLDLSSRPVKMFSFHNTNPFTMACKQSHYAELRNAYAGVLQSKVQYTSDSNGYWIYRSWEQLLDEKHNRIQVLTHPEWWLTQEAEPAEKVCRELQHRSQFCWTAYRRLLERGRDNKTGLTVAKDLLPALFQEDGERLLMLWLDGRIELAYFETFCRLECRARSLAKELLRCQLQIPATQVTELLEDHQLQLDPLRCLALVAETQIVDLIGLDEPTFRKVKNHLKTTAHVTGGVAKLELAESFDQICFAISNLTQWVKSRYFDFEESAMLSTAETPSTGANHETLLSWLKQHQKALKLHDCALAGFLNGS